MHGTFNVKSTDERFERKVKVDCTVCKMREAKLNLCPVWHFQTVGL